MMKPFRVLRFEFRGRCEHLELREEIAHYLVKDTLNL